MVPDGSGTRNCGERSSSVSTGDHKPDQPGRQAADNKVGYPFVAYPAHIMGPLIRQGKLIPRDVSVLTVLISFANQFRDSCWCKIKTIKEQANCSERTVKNSLGRLAEHGVISHRKVSECGEPDPLQPQNRTGWRWVFLWNQTLRYPTEEPDRRPPLERKQPRLKEAPGQMHLFASPPMQTVASPPMQPVASKIKREVKQAPKLSQNTTTTACDGATQPRACEAPAESSSSFSATQDSQISGNLQSSVSQPLSRAGRVADRSSDQARGCGLAIGSVREATTSMTEAEVRPPAELIDQAAARFPEVAAQPELAAADVRHYGPDRFRLGLEFVAIKDDSPDPVATYRFLQVWLDNKRSWSLEAIQAENERIRMRRNPKKPKPARQENWNPGPLVEQLDEATKMLRAEEVLARMRGIGCDLELDGEHGLKPIGNYDHPAFARFKLEAKSLKPQIRRLREAEFAADQAAADNPEPESPP